MNLIQTDEALKNIKHRRDVFLLLILNLKPPWPLQMPGNQFCCPPPGPGWGVLRRCRAGQHDCSLVNSCTGGPANPCPSSLSTETTIFDVNILDRNILYFKHTVITILVIWIFLTVPSLLEMSIPLLKISEADIPIILYLLCYCLFPHFHTFKAKCKVGLIFLWGMYLASYAHIFVDRRAFCKQYFYTFHRQKLSIYRYLTANYICVYHTHSGLIHTNRLNSKNTIWNA